MNRKIILLSYILLLTTLAFGQRKLRVDILDVSTSIKLNSLKVTSISTDGTFTTADDESIATTLAIKTYIDNQVLNTPSYYTADQTTTGTRNHSADHTITIDHDGADHYRNLGISVYQNQWINGTKEVYMSGHENGTFGRYKNTGKDFKFGVNSTSSYLEGGDGTEIGTVKTLETGALEFNSSIAEYNYPNQPAFTTNNASNFMILDASGDMKIRTFASLGIGSSAALEDADGDTKVEVEQNPDEDYIRFTTAGTERGYIDNTGILNFSRNGRTVTIDPYSGTAFTGASGGWAIGHNFVGSLGTQFGGFQAKGTTDNLEYWTVGGNDYNTAYLNAPLKIYKQNVDSEKMRLDANGNLAVGTTSPSTKLTIGQSADAVGLRVWGYDDHSDKGLDMYVDQLGQTAIASVNSSAFIYKSTTMYTQLTGSMYIGVDGINYAYRFHSGAFIPLLDNTRDLGSITLAWRNLYLKGALYDSNNESGTLGQVYTSTVTGTDWTDPVASDLTGLTDQEVVYGDTDGTIKQREGVKVDGLGLVLKAVNTTPTFKLLRTLNSSNVELWALRYDGVQTFNGVNFFAHNGTDPLGPQAGTGRGFTMQGNGFGYAASLLNLSNSAANNFGGSSSWLKTEGTVSPTASIHAFNFIEIANTINQTGTATGITRGLYINPTITAAADFRALEMANNSGFGIYQSGVSATNYFAGDVGIGTPTPDAPLDVESATIGPIIIAESGGNTVETNIQTTFASHGTTNNIPFHLVANNLIAVTLDPAGEVEVANDLKLAAGLVDSDDYAFTENDRIGFDNLGNVTAKVNGNNRTNYIKLIDHDASIFNSGSRYMQNWVPVDDLLTSATIKGFEVHVITKGGVGCDIDFSLDVWKQSTETYTQVGTLNLEEEYHEASGVLNHTLTEGDRIHLKAAYNGCGGIYPEGLSLSVITNK